MKKKYMIIYALILCLGIGIIIGLVINNKKTEKNDNNSNTEYVEKLEKENEELNKQLEEINEKNEAYSNSSKDEEKTKGELLDIIEKAQFEDNGYQYIVDNVMDSFYRYAMIHALPYCGEHANDIEYIEIKDGEYSQYWESYTFKNKDEVNNFFFGFLSENYYNNKIKKYYVEKDNKLYCYAPGRGVLFYKPEESDFKVITISDNKIEVFAKTIWKHMAADEKIDAYATLIKENGSWVVDEYKEFR